jgi:hypothetical protein
MIIADAKCLTINKGKKYYVAGKSRKHCRYYLECALRSKRRLDIQAD